MVLVGVRSRKAGKNEKIWIYPFDKKCLAHRITLTSTH